MTALSNGERKLTLYPDPVLEAFDGGTLYFQSKNDYLTVEVRIEPQGSNSGLKWKANQGAAVERELRYK